MFSVTRRFWFLLAGTRWRFAGSDGCGCLGGRGIGGPFCPSFPRRRIAVDAQAMPGKERGGVRVPLHTKYHRPPTPAAGLLPSPPPSMGPLATTNLSGSSTSTGGAPLTCGSASEIG